VLLEHLAKDDDAVPSYCGVRTRTHTFVHYATGEEELYDLARDPWQLQDRSRRSSSRTTLDLLRALTRSLCGEGPPDPTFDWA
jgi:hypothetical protein